MRPRVKNAPSIRSTSNTPLQALDLLNDPIYVEAARVFAQNAIANGGKTFRTRLDWVFDRALNRPPDGRRAFHPRRVVRDGI